MEFIVVQSIDQNIYNYSVHINTIYFLFHEKQ